MEHCQLVTEVGRDVAAAAEDACFALGASSVTLADAADDPVLEPAPGAIPLWPQVRLTALFAVGGDMAAIAGSLAAELGLDAAAIRIEDVPDRPWEREWLRDFRPMCFGRRLWICPGGQAAPAADAVVLELDPGLAFGTGTHPTTALCLEWLDQAGVDGLDVLDYGCGSGILALAALKLGARRATAVDIDPQALLATCENAARNALGHLVDVRPADEPLRAGYDVVLANILAGPLVELAPGLARLTAPGGRIVLAGMLTDQADAVAQAYGPWFHMKEFAAREGWTVLSGHRVAG